MSRRNPLLKISLAYLAGLATGSLFIPDSTLLIITTSTILIAFLGIYYYRLKSPILKADNYVSIIHNWSIIVSVYFLALLNLNLSGYHYKITKITSIPSGKIKYAELIVDEILSSDSGSITLNVINLRFNEKQRLKIKMFVNDISPGDTLTGTCYSYPVNDSRSNRSFKKYLALKSIYSLCYMYSGSFSIKASNYSGEKRDLKNLKNRFIKLLNQRIPNKQRSSVIIALTSGYKKDMELETTKAFSRSGAMHLMAVSGLHLNFIHLILSYSLMWMGNFKIMKRIRCLTILYFMWNYAFFTGMQESILRASIMISCSEVSRITGRRSFGLNTLCFSFLLICVFNPISFFNPGFRLSFAATLSILIINPLLLKLIKDAGKIRGYIWNSISLSLSCQLGTLPLSILYFGFIPSYFMLSNLLAIPLSAIIIILTFLLILTDGTLLTPYIAQLLENSSSVLIWTVKNIERLPFSTIYIK
jgi:competence protein ComEC